MWGCMNLKQLVQVLHQYDAQLEQRSIEAQRHQGVNSPFADATGMLQHARWMCQETLKFLPKENEGMSTEDRQKITEKAMRWLGFIQGVLWSTSTRSIDEMRADNTA